MSNYKTTILLAALSTMVTGCPFDSDNNGGSGAAFPAAQTYTATVTSVSMVNKDSGETLEVDRLPLQGGVLTVE